MYIDLVGDSHICVTEDLAERFRVEAKFGTVRGKAVLQGVVFSVFNAGR